MKLILNNLYFMKKEGELMGCIFDKTMATMNWNEIEGLGHKGIPVLFPLGVIEEHGPHLPLGTDIYFSYAVCKKIKEEIERMEGKCLIAPPYYWGINHCTGAFPGSFSLREETMRMVLLDLFENLNRFGFERIYCINEHGDPVHVKTILDAIHLANETYNMKIKMLIEPYELCEYGLTGNEVDILVDYADYPMELFADDGELLDIHAGAFETAAMKSFYEDILDEEIVKNLPDHSLNFDSIEKWNQGAESARNVVPLGYAGNPSAYEEKLQSIKMIFPILCKYVAEKIIEGNPCE